MASASSHGRSSKDIIDTTPFLSTVGRSDSTSIVVTDVLWYLVMVVGSVGVLIINPIESPETPLRRWIIVHSLLCAFNAASACIHYWGLPKRIGKDKSWFSVAKHLESANTVFSYTWSTMGCYWIIAGGQSVANAPPQLYWLCVVLLVLDVAIPAFLIAIGFVIWSLYRYILPFVIRILENALGDEEPTSGEAN